MKITRAAVAANPKKPQTAKLKAEVEKFLLAHGVKLSGMPQLVITIGGDGTVLYNKSHYGVPFFGIGSNTSFICQATFANWREKLPRVLGSLKAEPRLMLACSIDGKKMPLSLNEIGIRNPEPRVLSLHLAIGKRHFAFRADGLLICTPTGAPAYCYSCGGKQMKKNDSRYQVVAISPFRRIFRPLILARNARCTLRISGPERATFFIDGQDFGSFTSKNTLRVWACKRQFLFAKA
jgi:NAD+ kinase